eukprot:9951339-Alexandrium_andersonii.AAC.1
MLLARVHPLMSPPGSRVAGGANDTQRRVVNTPHASAQLCCEIVGTQAFVSQGRLPSQCRIIAGLCMCLRELRLRAIGLSTATGLPSQHAQRAKRPSPRLRIGE